MAKTDGARDRLASLLGDVVAKVVTGRDPPAAPPSEPILPAPAMATAEPGVPAGGARADRMRGARLRAAHAQEALRRAEKENEDAQEELRAAETAASGVGHHFIT